MDQGSAVDAVEINTLVGWDTHFLLAGGASYDRIHT